MKRYPYFPFFGRDFMMSPTVRSMSSAQVGIYILLLSLDWDNDGLPDDDAACMAYLPRDATETDFDRVIREFREKHAETARRTHKRANAERIRNSDFSSKQAENGRKGGRPPKVNGFTEETQNNPPLFMEKAGQNPRQAPDPNPNPQSIPTPRGASYGEIRPESETDAIRLFQGQGAVIPDDFVAMCYNQLKAVGWVDAALRPVVCFPAYVRKSYAQQRTAPRKTPIPVAKKRPNTQTHHEKRF